MDRNDDTVAIHPRQVHELAQWASTSKRWEGVMSPTWKDVRAKRRPNEDRVARHRAEFDARDVAIQHGLRGRNKPAATQTEEDVMIGISLAVFRVVALILLLITIQEFCLTQSLLYRTQAVHADISGDHATAKRYRLQSSRMRRFGWPSSVILPSQRRARRLGLLDWWPDERPTSGA
jgi:hypothetical protein